ncbi:MAG: NAD-dependent protein deacylase [Alphaproteobacteria bacterium MarineAlpha3_Bin7]|nr:MAG: NAD-dependent protein deacylase [Alphaproteobacteria bacterium MarineAlpha3_Bin7]|tara:strand:- start:86 stop:811 length:726 start_codon:yes stop_codon:yes gene_type:complete
MRHKNIVILTGAGISKESGIDTFRDRGGIWSKVKVENVATPQAYERDPSTVQNFYNERRNNLLDTSIKPNAAHFALAKLEREWPGNVAVVTQNIDNLHEAAGTKNLIHMHGELLKARCANCGLVLGWEKPLGEGEKCPDCHQKTLRPHVVWFGEMPLMMDTIDQLLSDCNLFLSIGTSGNVYPASGFVQVANSCGSHTVEINLEPSEGASLFKESKYGVATKLVPDFVDTLISNQQASLSI